MSELYPVTIVTDRYGGSYSGGAWLAFHLEPESLSDIPFGGGDTDEMNFWFTEQNKANIGIGQTPDEALRDLTEKLRGKE